MTIAQPAAPHPADRARTAAVDEEPSRFTAYATGSAAGPYGALDLVLRSVERLLVPELSRMSRRRVSRPRSRS